jgi:hypothetical protein
MHRDVKPHNVMIEHEKRKAWLLLCYYVISLLKMIDPRETGEAYFSTRL